MTQQDPDLETAYALETPDDSRRLYAAWAETYDQGFAAEMDYRMPQVIAEAYRAAADGAAPVADIGAGTGLVGQYLSDVGITPLDALDISAEMLAVAGRRGVYRNLIECDLTTQIDIPDATYNGVVSAGTFTHGHVGPGALDELLRIARPGALFVLGINAKHFESHGFAARFDALSGQIRDLHRHSAPIYGPGADAAHQHDLAEVTVFWKSE